MKNNAATKQISCNIAIVGGGTSGLALATKLRQLGIENVVILERETEAGGIPRHCGHYPFGLREFKRLLKGPQYARRLVAQAQKEKVAIQTNATVTALNQGGQLNIATDKGVHTLNAKRVVLCTGVRESSRAQRIIGGQRPLGILSTGALQSLVYLQGHKPFQRPVILGTELVSFSAVQTCRHLGIRPIAMLEENQRVTVRNFMRPYPALMGIPINFGIGNLKIYGDPKVEKITFKDAHGDPKTIETDGVIISGKFRPESALLHMSHLEIDPASGGPSVDQYSRCSDPSYYATGNLLRPVETSSWCWHEANDLAETIVEDLQNTDTLQQGKIVVKADHPEIKYVVPQRLSINHAGQTSAPITQFQIRLNAPMRGELSAISNGRKIWSMGLNSMPERRILAPLQPILSSQLDSDVNLTILETS